MACGRGSRGRSRPDAAGAAALQLPGSVGRHHRRLARPRAGDGPGAGGRRRIADARSRATSTSWRARGETLEATGGQVLTVRCDVDAVRGGGSGATPGGRSLRPPRRADQLRRRHPGRPHGAHGSGRLRGRDERPLPRPAAHDARRDPITCDANTAGASSTSLRSAARCRCRTSPRTRPASSRSSVSRAAFARSWPMTSILVTTVSPGLMRTGSPINASMKGRHKAEFAWFAVSDALPGLSVASSRAARQIVEACRRGQAELIIGLPAQACRGILWSHAEHLRDARLAGEPLPANCNRGRGGRGQAGTRQRILMGAFPADDAQRSRGGAEQRGADSGGGVRGPAE